MAVPLPEPETLVKDEIREIGRKLADRWLQRGRELQQGFRQAMLRPVLHSKYDFIRALYQHARGDSRYLIEYLRSRRPLTSADREQFARVLEGVLSRKKKRGRPRDSVVRDAAFQANVFYRVWIDENRANGVRDHGHRDAMKNEAIRFVVEELELQSPTVDQEKVRELLCRPKCRRNLPSDSA
jgi:hypothetical protein